MNKNYTTRNFNVLSTKGDFKLFHDYLIDYNVLEKEKQYHFDIVNLSSEGKLNMLVDCVYELSMFKTGLQTTTEKFKPLEVFSFKTMFVNVLEIINILKPYVLESEFLSKMNVGNYFRAVFDDVMIGDIKYKTKEYDILELLDYFNKKEKEYETKATFYTAAENQNKIKDYTKETWFIVGSNFVDGTVYKLYNDGKGLLNEDLVKEVFKNEFLNLDENKLKDLINRYKEYVYYSSNTKGKEAHSKNMFKNNSTKIKRWQMLYDYFIEKGQLIDDKFYEDYKKHYRVAIY